MIKPQYSLHIGFKVGDLEGMGVISNIIFAVGKISEMRVSSHIYLCYFHTYVNSKIYQSNVISFIKLALFSSFMKNFKQRKPAEEKYRKTDKNI